MSGGKGPIILFLLRDREVGGVKINTNLIKIVIGFNEVREEVKAF